MLFLVSKHCITALETNPNTLGTLYPISDIMKYEKTFRDRGSGFYEKAKIIAIINRAYAEIRLIVLEFVLSQVTIFFAT